MHVITRHVLCLTLALGPMLVPWPCPVAAPTSIVSLCRTIPQWPLCP